MSLSLGYLPTDILLTIFNFLSPHDIYKLALTANKELRSNDELWYNVMLKLNYITREYKHNLELYNRKNNTNYDNWYSVYMDYNNTSLDNLPKLIKQGHLALIRYYLNSIAVKYTPDAYNMFITYLVNYNRNNAIRIYRKLLKRNTKRIDEWYQNFLMVKLNNHKANLDTLFTMLMVNNQYISKADMLDIHLVFNYMSRNEIVKLGTRPILLTITKDIAELLGNDYKSWTDLLNTLYHTITTNQVDDILASHSITLFTKRTVVYASKHGLPGLILRLISILNREEIYSVLRDTFHQLVLRTVINDRGDEINNLIALIDTIKQIYTLPHYYFNRIINVPYFTGELYQRVASLVKAKHNIIDTSKEINTFYYLSQLEELIRRDKEEEFIDMLRENNFISFLSIIDLLKSNRVRFSYYLSILSSDYLFYHNTEELLIFIRRIYNLADNPRDEERLWLRLIYIDRKFYLNNDLLTRLLSPREGLVINNPLRIIKILLYSTNLSVSILRAIELITERYNITTAIDHLYHTTL